MECSGELVGYVDLRDPGLNYASFENSEVLASHVMVKRLGNKIKFELGYFGIRGMLSYLNS